MEESVKCSYFKFYLDKYTEIFCLFVQLLYTHITFQILLVSLPASLNIVAVSVLVKLHKILIVSSIILTLDILKLILLLYNWAFWLSSLFIAAWLLELVRELTPFQFIFQTFKLFAKELRENEIVVIPFLLQVVRKSGFFFSFWWVIKKLLLNLLRATLISWKILII